MIFLHEGRCEDVLPTLPDASVDLILTDPPYFKVKGEAWDRQWDKPEQFLAWLGGVADEWRRVLKPNGSLYCFASPRMAARVEVLLGERFTVLNQIRWVKDAGWHNKARPSDLRRWLSPWEAIIVCEQFGADGSALMGSGYSAACQELHAGVFEPLRQYLVTERDRAGFTNRQVDEHLGTAGMAGHYFGASQWALPTRDAYERIRALFNGTGGDYLRREYEDLRREYEDLRREYEDLRREYEDLRREYEDLRRPFTADACDRYDDTWNDPTAPLAPNRHPCEKPASLLDRIITASTRPDAIILDCFAGSGSTLFAAERAGLDSIGIEMSAEWCDTIRRKIAQNEAAPPLPLEGAA